MWRLSFALCLAWPAVGVAQAGSIPGRDLLAFPLALTAEPAALGTQAGTGLWNPATAVLPAGARWRLSATAMSAPTDVTVAAQVGAVAGVWRRTTLAFTVARAAVSGLLRTDSDPQVLGDDIAYSTLVVSAVAARRFTPHLFAGFALRVRNGRLDDLSRTGLALDAGVVAEHLGPLDSRVGVSSFLLSPAAGSRERTSVLAAADTRVAGADSARTVRAGYALEHTAGLSTEEFIFASARWGRWEARGGPVRTTIFGASNWRARFGIAVRHASYVVGIAREESVNGLAPTYYFSLTSVVR